MSYSESYLGFLHIIIGPMFSGKSTRLINEINTLKMYKKNILIINSNKDSRVANNFIKTHNNIKYNAIKLNELDESKILSIIKKYDTLCIDEAQFFSNLIPFVKKLLEYNIHIIVAGLNGDTQQNKFGHIIDLIPWANKIDKLSGICTLCNDGTPGDFSILKKNMEKKEQILVGGDDMYQCVCRKHIFN
tara:strand:- start:1889 stop:2455 length:567 start_codon:yes stop_codon:yes gene_type:complete